MNEARKRVRLCREVAILPRSQARARAASSRTVGGLAPAQPAVAVPESSLVWLRAHFISDFLAENTATCGMSQVGVNDGGHQ